MENLFSHWCQYFSPVPVHQLLVCSSQLVFSASRCCHASIYRLYIVVLQQLEGNIIYPKVVGSSMGLPGIWVLAAVTVGGGVLGITGMLLGVPLAAAIYRLVRDDVNKTS